MVWWARRRARRLRRSSCTNRRPSARRLTADPRVAAVRRHAVASAPAPSTQPVRVGPSTRSTTAARPRPVARSLTLATTIVSAPPRPVRGCRRTLQTQSRASSTGVAREGIVLIASSGPRGNPVRREPPHQQTPSHEHIAKVLLECLSSNTFEGAVGRSVSPAPAWRRGPPTAKHRTGRGAKKECWPRRRPGVRIPSRCVRVRAKTIRHRIWRRSCRGPPPRPPLSSTRHPPQEVAVTAAPLTPRDGRPGRRASTPASATTSRAADAPGPARPCCQWQPKTAHLWQPKTAHSWGGRLGRSGHSPGDARRAFWAGRRERSDRSPGQHAPRSFGSGGHVATPSRCSSDAVLSQC